MKMTVTESLFINQMSACPVARHGFTMEGMIKLYNHIVDYEDSFGEDWELDTVELAKRYEQVSCGLDLGDMETNPNLICIWRDRGLWYALKYM